jgi:hypothetical protein
MDTPMAKLGGETPEQTAARLEAERVMAVDGTEMQAILATPVMRKAMLDLGKDYYNQFLKAATPAAREEAWVKGRTLLDLAKELQSVVDRGRMAKHARKVRAAQEEGRKRRQKRQGLDVGPQEN